MGIPWKLEEVFVNVLLNSLHACEQDDSITIETHHDAFSVKVVITDTGHGISEDNVSQVFDPFFTTKDVGKGTGIGLSVCYNIVKQHGGEISLMSSELTGTVVTITFPVAANGNGQIIVVDDDQDLRESIVEILQANNFSAFGCERDRLLYRE